MRTHQVILDMLRACGSESGVLPPTIFYNEGWMLRLVLYWFATHSSDGDHPLRFFPKARWYSEALLHTQFKARSRGDSLAESWTHADGVIGHFTIGSRAKGDLALLPDARQLVITEAKMFSGLSPGTTRAKAFDQAARNVACLAETLRLAGRRPHEVESLGFIVLAPADQIVAGIFTPYLDLHGIMRKVEQRVEAYAETKTAWYSDWFVPTAERCMIQATSWESVVQFVTERDPATGAEIAAFLAECLRHNRPTTGSRNEDQVQLKRET